MSCACISPAGMERQTVAIETIAFHHETESGDSLHRLESNGTASVAVVDEHDAIHAAVELWCNQAQPPIGFAGTYFSAEQFLAEHPSPSGSRVGPIVLELQQHRNGVDFTALDRIVSRRHRVIVYSHIATDEVILTALDRGAVTYLTKSESKSHLIDAIRAAGFTVTSLEQGNLAKAPPFVRPLIVGAAEAHWAMTADEEFEGSGARGSRVVLGGLLGRSRE